MLTKDYEDQVVRLILKDGNIFKATSFKSRHPFETECFLIRHVNESNSCVTLQLLKSCQACRNDYVLAPLDEEVIINKQYICGYQALANPSIRKCKHPFIEIHDCVSGAFTITRGFTESIIWQSNIISDGFASIDLWLERGERDLVELRIYYNDIGRDCAYPLISTHSIQFSLRNCTLIKVIKKEESKKVHGEYKIKMDHEIVMN